MEKSDLQVEWDKIKESNLLKITTIQKKHYEQIRVLSQGSYDHKKHVVFGWVYLESFDYVLLQDVVSKGIFKMPLYRYVRDHYRSTGKDINSLTMEEQGSLESMVRNTFDQIFI
jgi:hypothetical protein